MDNKNYIRYTILLGILTHLFVEQVSHIRIGKRLPEVCSIHCDFVYHCTALNVVNYEPLLMRGQKMCCLESVMKDPATNEGC